MKGHVQFLPGRAGQSEVTGPGCSSSIPQHSSSHLSKVKEGQGGTQGAPKEEFECSNSGSLYCHTPCPGKDKGRLWCVGCPRVQVFLQDILWPHLCHEPPELCLGLSSMTVPKCHSCKEPENYLAPWFPNCILAEPWMLWRYCEAVRWRTEQSRLRWSLKLIFNYRRSPRIHFSLLPASCVPSLIILGGGYSLPLFSQRVSYQPPNPSESGDACQVLEALPWFRVGQVPFYLSRGRHGEGHHLKC